MLSLRAPQLPRSTFRSLLGGGGGGGRWNRACQHLQLADLPCTSLQGIKKIAHFRFSADHPGEVFYKASLAEEESGLNLLKSRDAFGELGAMPDIIPAPGPPRERQQYLFSQMREFVREDQRDVVCPNPGN